MIHLADIDEKSKFFDILKSKRINVNSYHHQSIKNVGKGIRIVAKDKDDIVEAIQVNERSSMTLGIQWHPEAMQSTDNIQLSIFQKFISCAKGDYKW